MDYHIVRNTSTEPVNNDHRNLRDWHFEAQLFGAAMVILLLPLISTFFGNRLQQQKVLGASTRAVSTYVVYDSEQGYVYDHADQVENTDFFSKFISSLLSIFR